MWMEKVENRQKHIAAVNVRDKTYQSTADQRPPKMMPLLTQSSSDNGRYQIKSEFMWQLSVKDTALSHWIGVYVLSKRPHRCCTCFQQHCWQLADDVDVVRAHRCSTESPLWPWKRPVKHRDGSLMMWGCLRAECVVITLKLCIKIGFQRSKCWNLPHMSLALSRKNTF